jgi:hypothetical protein
MPLRKEISKSFARIELGRAVFQIAALRDSSTLFSRLKLQQD